MAYQTNNDKMDEKANLGGKDKRIIKRLRWKKLKGLKCLKNL